MSNEKRMDIINKNILEALKIKNINSYKIAHNMFSETSI